MSKNKYFEIGTPLFLIAGFTLVFFYFVSHMSHKPQCGHDHPHEQVEGHDEGHHDGGHDDHGHSGH